MQNHILATTSIDQWTVNNLHIHHPLCYAFKDNGDANRDKLDVKNKNMSLRRYFDDIYDEKGFCEH